LRNDRQFKTSLTGQANEGLILGHKTKGRVW